MRSWCIALLAFACWPTQAQTLRDAVEAAWARQPNAQARTAREAELEARRLAAQALTPEPPAVGVAHLSDRALRRNGRRESELELAVPLWMPGQRVRRLATLDAEGGQLASGLSAAKWRIAGEVREAYWQTRLAEAELEVARRKVVEATALRGDVEKRFRAGDLARLEMNQAQAAEQAAAITLAEFQAKRVRAAQAFRALTGLSEAADSWDEPPGAGIDLNSHPALQALRRAVDASMARLEQTHSDTRDPPEVTVGVQREREGADESANNALFMRLRIPFATSARNSPRIAAANAELIEARAAYELERRRVEAEIEATRREYEFATSAIALADRRFALATDTQRLAGRGFALGEFDLVTRLRAENERFEAELALRRARLEAARAASNLNQAYGILP